MDGYFRKVIRITGEDSPNVQLARAQEERGLEPTGIKDGKLAIDGVLPWSEYKKRRATWDAIRQAIGLDAVFYKGAELLLFPPQWRALAEQQWVSLQGTKGRVARGIGVDPGEGGANTSIAVTDEYGIIELVSRKTPNTNLIPTLVGSMATRYGCPWERVVFDRGGGGKQIADRMRGEGKQVRTVGFGEGISLDLRRGMRLFTERLDIAEEKQVYGSRRAQMYGTLSELLHPDSARRFALPPSTLDGAAERLHKALAVIPRWYDHEDKLVLPPKNRKPGQKVGTGVKPLVEMIGFSPDEADAVVLAVEAMLGNPSRATAGAL